MLSEAGACWPPGYGRCILGEVDSTLDEARRRANMYSGPEWILALHQTAARGRRGRVWEMPQGNFAASLLIRPNETLQRAALRSFVAALALHDALADVSGGSAELAMKWPNDVLLGGGKVAGILLETVAQGNRDMLLAIGIGVNLVAAPGRDALEPVAMPPVSLLSECGVSVGPETFLAHLAMAYDRHESRFTTYGFEPIRNLWLELAANRGAPILARAGGAEYRGIFADVDKDGQLVLETQDGCKTIPAADVFF